MTVERLAVFNMVSVGQAAEALAYYWHESRPVCRGRGRRAGAPRPASTHPASARRRGSASRVIASVVASVVASVRPVSAEGRSRRAGGKGLRLPRWLLGGRPRPSPPASPERADGRARAPRPRAVSRRAAHSIKIYLEQISLCAFVHIADTYCTYGRSIFSQWHLHWRMTDGRRCQTQQLSVH